MQEQQYIKIRMHKQEVPSYSVLLYDDYANLVAV